MLKKIVITGPESTGKTTLAEQLGETLPALWVPEFARQYLDELNRPYRQSDLLEIAKGQIKSENYFEKKANDLLICDSDLLTIKIWSMYKYGSCHDFIIQTIAERPYDFYFLSYPDLPWVYDPQRENPNDRMELFDWYKNELDYYQKPYTILKGSEEARLAFAKKVIQKLK